MVHLLEELQKSEADIILLQEAGKHGEVKKTCPFLEANLFFC